MSECVCSSSLKRWGRTDGQSNGHGANEERLFPLTFYYICLFLMALFLKHFIKWFIVITSGVHRDDELWRSPTIPINPLSFFYKAEMRNPQLRSRKQITSFSSQQSFPFVFNWCNTLHKPHEYYVAIKGLTFSQEMCMHCFKNMLTNWLYRLCKRLTRIIKAIPFLALNLLTACMCNKFAHTVMLLLLLTGGLHIFV